MSDITELPLLAFGGIAKGHCLQLLEKPELAGILIGNSLNYTEQSYARLVSGISQSLNLRTNPQLL